MTPTPPDTGSGPPDITTAPDGTVMLRIAAAGPVLRSEQDALDIVSAAYGLDVDLVVVPVARLDAAVFDLSTRLLGEFTQKLLNYQLRVAIVGGISARTDGSRALSDFVGESNRGRQVWFLPDDSALNGRLAADDR